MGVKSENNNMEEKKQKQKTKTKTKEAPERRTETIEDPRFALVQFDPRFQRPPKHQSKVPIDPRFQRMFHDSTFSSSPTAAVDKRGKPNNVRDSQNHLRKYYRQDDEDEDEDDEEKKKDIKVAVVDDDEEIEIGGSKSGTESQSELEEESDGEAVSSSSSSTETSDEDESDFEEETAEEVENVPVIEKETKRLAIVNMDWSQVRAVDLYVLLTSFLPKNGQLMSVTVYPSEFGLKCMEEEAVHGPIGLFDSDKDESNDSDDNDDNEEIGDEKIRAYEKRRMRYYYAVVECDSVATADCLYKTCDGTEFERTSNVLDLRFIPDSMEFKHPPRDVATEVPTNYEGLDFHTRALQHSKPNLTWEEDEPQRSKILRRKFNADQLAKLELDEFLASDDGESSDDEEADDLSGKEVKKEKYLLLLKDEYGSDVEAEENDKDMEVTFNSGLENLSKRRHEKSKQESETVWEASLRKSREKKLARRNKSSKSSEDESSDADTEASEDFEQPDDFFIEEPTSKNDKVGKGTHKEKKQKGNDVDQGVSRAELELLLADNQGAEQSLKGYNLKPKKTKGKREKDIPSEDKIPEVDDNDPRFEARFNSFDFALDPTDPMFERSATYVRMLAQKQKGAGKHVKPANLSELPPDTAAEKDEELQSESVSKDKSKYEMLSKARSLKRKAQLAEEKKRANDKRIKRSKKHAPMQSDGTLQKKDKHGLSRTIQSLKEKAKAPRN